MKRNCSDFLNVRDKTIRGLPLQMCDGGIGARGLAFYSWSCWFESDNLDTDSHKYFLEHNFPLEKNFGNRHNKYLNCNLLF